MRSITIPARFVAIVAELVLIGIGPGLVCLYVFTSPEWTANQTMGDFIVMMIVVCLVSAWSCFGLVASAKRSVNKVRIYYMGLVLLVILDIIVGLIHTIILFVVHRPSIMNSCLQRQPTRLFWWSMGYEDNSEMAGVYQSCTQIWYQFLEVRIISWIVSCIIMVVATYLIRAYYVRLKISSQRPAADWEDTGKHGIQDQKFWSSVSPQTEKLPRGALEASPEEKEPLNKESDMYAQDMHRQRQQLYSEIVKRRQSKQRRLSHQSLTSDGSQRKSVMLDHSGAVHPCDISDTMPQIDEEDHSDEKTSLTGENKDMSCNIPLPPPAQLDHDPERTTDWYSSSVSNQDNHGHHDKEDS